MGAIHNLSSDAAAIKIIRNADGIPCLVQLLGSQVGVQGQQGGCEGGAGAAGGAVKGVQGQHGGL